MKTRSTIAIMSAIAASTVWATVIPEVTTANMLQPENSRAVNITYTLKNAPAVVTLDIETNCTAASGEVSWATIGGQAVCNAKGAVWRKVTEADLKDGVYTITWRPDHSWPGHKIAVGGIRAKITAWSLDNPPAYMTVDISNAAKPDTQRYYQSEEFVPGGVGNAEYKTSSLLMRKIKAKGVVWTMGSTETGRDSSREKTHKVELPENYYIGVYEVTQAQWLDVAGKFVNAPNYSAEGSMRPAERICFNEVRTKGGDHNEYPDYYYPKAPEPTSFIGVLRTRTGIDFDLPSEAQWEFAARAGNGFGYWGDGSALGETNLKRLGRFLSNNSDVQKNANNKYIFAANTDPHEGGTAIVGSYEANDWGLYDMYGNVWEMCLDWNMDNIATTLDTSGELIGGRVNISLSDPSKRLDGSSNANRIIRGGDAVSVFGQCRASYRDLAHPGFRSSDSKLVGFRVVCPAEVE